MFFWNDCASFSTLQLRFREIIALKLQMEAVDNFGTNLSLSAEQNTEALLSYCIPAAFIYCLLNSHLEACPHSCHDTLASFKSTCAHVLQ